MSTCVSLRTVLAPILETRMNILCVGLALIETCFLESGDDVFGQTLEVSRSSDFKFLVLSLLLIKSFLFFRETKLFNHFLHR